MNKIALGIIVINILFSLKGFNDMSFFNKFKFNIGAIKNGDYTGMLSSAFLHVDMTHLFFNMLTFYFFANNIVYGFGTKGLLIIYFVSLLAGNILTYFYHKNENHYSAVGASGAVSGIIFASILLSPYDKYFIMFIPIPIPAYIVGIGYLAYSLFGMKKQLGNIGHSAHLGGALAGMLLALLLRPELLQLRMQIIGLLAIPLIAFFIYSRREN